MDSTSGNWNPKWRGQEQRTRCRRLWQTRVQPNHVPCSDVTPEALLISKRPHKQCCISPPRLWADWKTKEWLAEDKISAFCEAKLKDRTLWWEQRESATWAWEWDTGMGSTGSGQTFPEPRRCVPTLWESFLLRGKDVDDMDGDKASQIFFLNFLIRVEWAKLSETLGVTPCSFPPLEGNVKGVAQVFPSLGFCASSQSVARSALQLYSILSLPAAKPYV